MFENSGSNLRGIAMVAFVLTVIGAAITLILGVVAGGAVGFFSGLISAAITIFAGWVSAVNLCALADAAEFSEEAAFNSREILKRLQKMDLGGGQSNPEARNPTLNQIHTPAAPQGKFDTNRVPAWKRVQMEQEGKTE